MPPSSFRHSTVCRACAPNEPPTTPELSQLQMQLFRKIHNTFHKKTGTDKTKSAAIVPFPCLCLSLSFFSASTMQKYPRILHRIRGQSMHYDLFDTYINITYVFSFLQCQISESFFGHLEGTILLVIFDSTFAISHFISGTNNIFQRNTFSFLNIII